MDPITALATAVGKVADLITEAMRGQTAEQRAKMWQWYVEDVEFWRGLFKQIEPTDRKP